MVKEFKLSSSLLGHAMDVRSVAVAQNNDIISGSRDRTAKYWKYNPLQNVHQEVMTYSNHQNFVGAVLYLEPSESYPDGLIVSGGYDHVIFVYKPGEPFPTFTFKGEHSNTICALTRGIEQNTFLSASWDNTARYWSLSASTNKPLMVFSGHEAAVWHVKQLSDGRIITASADKTIGVWDKDGKRLQSLLAHKDAVRCLEDFPELKYFISVSNDASIKVWNYSCENLNTYYGHTSFIYSIARCRFYGMDSFVTSDEDRSVRFWQNGENVSTIHLPAQSVWSVTCLPNGDIVTGSSDGIVRVFTVDATRVADESTLAKFNEEVNAIQQQALQEIGGVKVSDLPGKEALYDPGKREGQMKMIREGNGVVAYTWVQDGDKSHWEKVGDVLGGTDKDDKGKTVFEGKSYDFVFSVDVEEGKPPLKLPYNRGDDPYLAAQNFLSKNLLPSGYLEQVVNFILTNTKESYVPPTNTEYQDPFTGGSRYMPEGSTSNQNQAGLNMDPFTGGNSYSTSMTKTSQTNSTVSGANADPFTGSSSYTTLNQAAIGTFFPMTSYRSFDMGEPNVILNKLKEFNLKQGGNVKEEELQGIVSLCNGPPNDSNSIDVLFRLLDWPDDIVFPVLDVVRLAVRHRTNNKIISNVNNGIILEKLKTYINESCKIINNMIVSLRTICNLCLHETGESLIFNSRFDLLENFTSLSHLNKNCQIALATCLLNLTVLTIKRNDELGFSILSQVIPDILTKLSEAEAQFRMYVALGTLIVSAGKNRKEVKEKINENASFIALLQLHMFSSQNEIENKRMNCIKQLMNLL